MFKSNSAELSSKTHRYTATFTIALLTSTAIMPVSSIIVAKPASAASVCITPQQETLDDLKALSTDGTGLATLFDNKSVVGTPFVRVENPNGSLTFKIDSLYRVKQENGAPAPGADFEQVTSASGIETGYKYNADNSGMLTSTGAATYGASGGGASGVPPILSSVEATNNEIQELIRQRRELQKQQQVASADAVILPSPVPAQSEAQAGDSAAPAPSSARKNKKTAAVSSKPLATQQSPSDEYVDYSSNLDARVQSVWAQAFADYERHSNMAPGSGENLVRKQTTVGGITGGDITYFRQGEGGRETLQLGLLAGGTHTESRFNDTATVSDASQTQDGGFIGAYTTYTVNKFAVDAFFKTDFLKYKQRSTGPTTCPKGQVLVVDGDADMVKTDTGSTNEYVYTTGANVSYRFDLGNQMYFEPLVGFVFSATEYGNGAFDLGLEDGQMFRIQGGARVGRSWLDEDGRLFSLSLLGLLYSDVYVNGYTVPGNSYAASASVVDEGKLRVLAQLQGSMQLNDGLSLIGQVGVRGGEDLFGVGGRLGMRQEW